MISVIIPVYKTEKYLDICIRSVMNQSYQDFEIILVDDGSPDACPDLCDTWAARDPRIHVIHQKNSGLSAARNAGIEISNGEYIFFLDSDDALVSDALKRTWEETTQTQCDMVVFNLQSCDEELRPMQDDLTFIQEGTFSSKEVLSCFKQNVMALVTACSKLYKKTLFDKIRFPEGKVHEDELTCHWLINESEKISVIADKLYLYRRNPVGIVNKISFYRHADALFAWYERILLLKEYGLQEAEETQIVNFYQGYRACVPPLLLGNIQERKLCVQLRLLYLELYTCCKKCPALKSSVDQMKLFMLRWMPHLYGVLYFVCFNHARKNE